MVRGRSTKSDGRGRGGRVTRSGLSQTGSLAVAEWIERRAPRLAVGLVATHLVLCAVLFDPKIHRGGDSATYVLLAESVLRTGDGYSLSIGPGPPQPHVKYPPAYPALLAPLVAIFERNFVVLKLLSVFLTAAAVLVFCRYARRRRDPLLWFALALAFAVSPAVIDYSRWMLSEAPFLLFTLVALWQLDRDADETRMGRSFWLALAAAVAGFYTRSIGALLLLATTLCYLARRQWRKLLVHGVVGAGLTLPWLVRARLLLLESTSTPYAREFMLRNVYEPEEGYIGASEAVGRVLDNAWRYASGELPRALLGSDSQWTGNALVAALGVIVACLVLAGVARSLRRGPRARDYYMLLTVAAILLFQSSVSDVRYLVPLVPLILVYWADGAKVVARAIGSHSPSRWPPVLATASLAALALGAQAVRVPANVEMIRAYAAGDIHAGHHPAVRRLFEAGEWVKANTPADAVITVRKPRLFNAIANRRSVIYPFSLDPDTVLRVVRETDYVVVDMVMQTTPLYLVPALQHEPGRFYLVHSTLPPKTWVLGVRDGDLPADPLN